VPVEAVELEGQATGDLQATAEDLPHVAVTTMPAERFDPQRTPFDVVVLDPPRAGAGEVMDRVLRSRPRRVVHVACDPVAGARDVARAQRQGYTPSAMQLFDLFPRTRHVETVTVLDRGPAPSSSRRGSRKGPRRRGPKGRR
jgi:tRNA/tmRNA/rRNA uracil-C5-methylase (TrmA/RlmC/RlmD family)